MARGGDHLPFRDAGYPAVRFTVAVENYERQHQNVRTEAGKAVWRHDRGNGFPRSRQSDRAERARFGRAGCCAAMPPAPKAKAAVQTFTDIDWAGVPCAARYTVWQRRTDAMGWEAQPVRTTAETHVRLDGCAGRTGSSGSAR